MLRSDEKSVSVSENALNVLTKISKVFSGIYEYKIKKKKIKKITKSKWKKIPINLLLILLSWLCIAIAFYSGEYFVFLINGITNGINH